MDIESGREHLKSTENNSQMAVTNGITNVVSTASGPLKGAVALVTGAGRGIGAGIAKELALKGASVVVSYGNSLVLANELVKEIEALGSKAIAIQADVTKLDEIDTLFAQALEHFGRLDIAPSNSGKEKFQPLAKTTIEDFNEVFDINTRGAVLRCQSCARAPLARGPSHPHVHYCCRDRCSRPQLVRRK
jgi:NAD(P)-dependent dehydrogenase (short-subunit alcohol dehydrogenase family)